jgi:hypothetical protein
MKIALVLVVAVGVAAGEEKRQARNDPPKRSEVKALLARALNWPEPPPLSFDADVLADAGSGRFPVLVIADVSQCKFGGCRESHPWAALVERKSDGTLALLGAVALPCAEAPHGKMSAPDDRFRWGVTLVKDWDGDGRPELLAVYGYIGGDPLARLRELAIVNLGPPLTVAAQVTLDRWSDGEGMADPATWRIAGTPPTLSIGPSGSSGGSTTKRALAYDASTDQWILGKP